MDYLKPILGILLSFVILTGLNMLYILIGRYITNFKKCEYFATFVEKALYV